MVELPGEERVVAVDMLVVGRGDEGSCCVSTLVLPCVTYEPPIQDFVAAAKARHVVAGCVEAFSAGEPGSHARSRNSRRRPTVS